MKLTATGFLFLTLLFISCHKETEHINTSTLLPCHNNRNLDSASLAAKLVGNWKFNRWECGEFNSAQDADRDSKVNFKHDGTLVFTDNGAITNATWKLVIGPTGHKYQLATIPDLGHFRGRILLCEDNTVVFNNRGGSSGCDMEYVRY
jgi:hypothetical protein